jgi:uncharacterized protein YndB with AHSA1/START domain
VERQEVLVKTWLRVAILVLAAVFVLYGIAYLIIPPTEFRVRVEVERPVGVAWHVFADESRMEDWLGGFQSLETISGEPGEPGSRHRLTFVEDGQEIAFEEEVLSRVDYEKFSFRMTHPMMTGEYEIAFEDIDARSAIVVDGKVRGEGFLRPMMPMMRASMVERVTADYERLKRLIENEPEQLTIPRERRSPAD